MESRIKIALLPGDGIGPEIMKGCVKIIETMEKISQINFELKEFRVGGSAIDEYGKPLKKDDLQEIKNCDCVLLGAVGGPKWDNLPYEIRPEQALLTLRKELNLFANLRPVKIFDSLLSASPLKEDIVRGTDIIILRELTGGIYYGEPRGMNEREGYNTDRYSREEIERIARKGFELARERRKKITSIDKANVLEVYKFWRKVVTEVARDYPDVELEHLYVDNASMQLIKNPSRFDVILCPNMFGDILSDEAAMIAGSIGLLPSASVGKDKPGLFEPVHGSAPDIAGKGIANPLAMIMSFAMFMEISLQKKDLAGVVYRAVRDVLDRGFRTPDMKGAGNDVKVVDTASMVSEVINSMKGIFN